MLLFFTFEGVVIDNLSVVDKVKHVPEVTTTLPASCNVSTSSKFEDE